MWKLCSFWCNENSSYEHKLKMTNYLKIAGNSYYNFFEEKIALKILRNLGGRRGKSN